jgi:phosphopantothenoylcysteine decarboxylase/phosphopantothenate--cysteine ligase
VNDFSGKRILLGVTGGIAAYKVVDLASQLIKAGADVQVVMTENACKFISPLTFKTITKRPVLLQMFRDASTTSGVEHIELAEFPDLIVVAPATGNFIGKIALGLADDLLSTVLMASRSKIIFAPAMNTNMLKSPAVQLNLQLLKDRGHVVVEADSGLLACGAYGAGRLPPTEQLLQVIAEEFINSSGILAGKRVIVTAGPTRAYLDPVRYLTNRSSGKMGYALARTAVRMGAEVILISGPVALEPPDRVDFIKVETAEEMHEIIVQRFDATDVVVMAAAVLDFAPADYSFEKIKKSDTEQHTLLLRKNIDILRYLGEKKNHQFLVGFAAETNNREKNAHKKMQDKNLDMIVLNDVSRQDAGFDVDANEVKIFMKNGEQIDIPLMSKDNVADIILKTVAARLDN